MAESLVALPAEGLVAHRVVGQVAVGVLLLPLHQASLCQSLYLKNHLNIVSQKLSDRHHPTLLYQCMETFIFTLISR